MITSRVPSSWQNLQHEVARILSECDFAVEEEHYVNLGRGGAKVDVYAAEQVRGRRNLILCECKYWSKAIPQSVVHAFRTVIAESGANAGYIISRKGFQAGAFAASERTNLRLVTWEQFQTDFEPTWVVHHLAPKLDSVSSELRKYTGPFESAEIRARKDVDQAAYAELIHRYWPLLTLIAQLSSADFASGPESCPSLPLRDWQAGELDAGIPDEILDAVAYDELERTIAKVTAQAALEFREGALAKIADLNEENWPFGAAKRSSGS